MHMCGLIALAFGLFSIFWEISLIYAGACQCRALKSSKSQNQNLKMQSEVDAVNAMKCEYLIRSLTAAS